MLAGAGMGGNVVAPETPDGKQNELGYTMWCGRAQHTVARHRHWLHCNYRDVIHCCQLERLCHSGITTIRHPQTTTSRANAPPRFLLRCGTFLRTAGALRSCRRHIACLVSPGFFRISPSLCVCASPSLSLCVCVSSEQCVSRPALLHHVCRLLPTGFASRTEAPRTWLPYARPAPQ